MRVARWHIDDDGVMRPRYCDEWEEENKRNNAIQSEKEPGCITITVPRTTVVPKKIIIEVTKIGSIACREEIDKIQNRIRVWLWGAKDMVQKVKMFSDINTDSFVAAQKSCFEAIMEAGIAMTDALIKEYGLENQEEIEDLRNKILGMQKWAESIWK